MKWKEPYMIESKMGDDDYRVYVNGKVKTYDVNILKKFYKREESVETNTTVWELVTLSVSQPQGITSNREAGVGDATLGGI